MLVDNFEDFQKMAVELYNTSPEQTRFTQKYRNCDGIFVLKATNDRMTITFKSDKVQDLKKLEKLNRQLLFDMLDSTPPEQPLQTS